MQTDIPTETRWLSTRVCSGCTWSAQTSVLAGRNGDTSTMDVVLVWCLVLVGSLCAVGAADVEVDIGAVAFIPCTGSDSSAQVTWSLPQGEEITAASGRQDYQISGSTLRVKEVQVSDAGVYTCSEGADGGHRVTVSVSVRGAPLRYWEQHADNITKAVIGALVFAVLAAGLCFLLRRRCGGGTQKPFSDSKSDRGHENPSVELSELETHF